MLGLLLSTEEEMIADLEIGEQFGNIDHNIDTTRIVSFFVAVIYVINFWKACEI